MIDLILSLLGGFKGLIVGAFSLIAGIWALWAKRKIGRQADTIAEQDRAISTYKVKEEVHQQDGKTDAEAYQKILELEEKVDHAESPEQAAGHVSGALDGYFGGDKK